MSFNLIELIKGQFGPGFVSQFATQLGESEGGISKALGALLPAVVGGLASNAKNPAVLDTIASSTSPGDAGNIFNSLGGNNTMISSLLTSIFGDKLSSLISQVASFAGISTSSTQSLLNAGTTGTVNAVGEYAREHHLGANGISSLLESQKAFLPSLLPAGLSLGSLGLGNLFGGSAEVPTNVENTIPPNIHTSKAEVPNVEAPKVEIHKTEIPPHPTNEKKSSSSWLWLLLLLLLGIALAWYFFGRDNKDSVMLNSHTDSTQVSLDTPNTASTNTHVDLDLNGITIKGYHGGMEEQMIAFLKAGEYDNATSDETLKEKWYDFDHVTFKMGSATELEEGSLTQLENLKAILKAYPAVKVKIGGYTDRTGNENDNIKLSQNRADFIKTWLTDQGVGAQVAGAEGYGSKFATVDASASNEERAADRKMAVRFSK